MKPLVSLIIPIYNMAAYIDNCMARVLQQDYAPLEILLVDDGSTDDSLRRCQALCDADARVTVLHQPNSGSGPARNLGLAHAAGDYVLFADADDCLAPDAVTKLVQATQDGLYDTVVFGYETRTFSGHPVAEKTYAPVTRTGDEVRQDYGDYIGEGAPLRIQGAPWNKLFSMQIIRAHGVTYPSLRRHQDEGFIGRYMCHAQRIRFIPDRLYTYHVSDLKRQWDRFPVDYLDAVIGLYEDRQRTILQWNPQDVRTRDAVNREYILTALRAIEMSFSPKFGFDAKRRMAWIDDAIARAGLAQIQTPPGLGPSKALELSLIQRGKRRTLYALLQGRVLLEQMGLFDWVRRFKRL